MAKSAVLCVVIVAAAHGGTASADPLLKTFRDEFVHITPGKNGFPAEFTMGREAGGDESERPLRRASRSSTTFTSRDTKSRRIFGKP
jgi:hypothetical protein